MGFFSSDCHGCGHPLLSLPATTEINAWMVYGVAITPDNTVIEGWYDGYGRLLPDEAEEDVWHDDVEAVVQGHGGGNSIWHQACWNAAGKPGYTGPSSGSDDQGWFFPDGAHSMREPGLAAEIAIDAKLAQAMRDAAETLINASQRYGAFSAMHYEWSAADLLREANHVEAEG